MEERRPSLSHVDPPACLADLSPELLALIATFLPGNLVAKGLLSASKFFFEPEQLRSAVTALSFREYSGGASDQNPGDEDGGGGALVGCRCHGGPRCEIYQTELDCNCGKIMDEVVVALADRFPGLTSMALKRCYELTASAVVALAGHCPGLTSVNLLFCNELTNAAVMALAGHCPGITSVILERCYEMTEAAVMALAEHCPGLTSVDPPFCYEMTNAAVVALAEHCSRLLQWI